MKLIINCSHIKATGATQVSVSFIKECIRYAENEYHVFMSKTISSQFDYKKFPSNFSFYIFDNKPFFDLKGLQAWYRLTKLESSIAPDCVLTVFGPGVWKPNAPHIMGYAYPYYIYEDSPFYNQIDSYRKFKIFFYKMFHKILLERNGSYYICETNDVAERLPNYLKCKKDNIFVVTNTFSDVFESFLPGNIPKLEPKTGNEFRLITLSSFSIHKNLTILNKVIPILKREEKQINFKFVLTISGEAFEKNFTSEVKENIVNLGRVAINDCPQIYSECDAMFLPTLMECFSASYAESMKMGIPILTSNLPFAKTVCLDAALYFDPLDPEEIANQIIALAKSKKKQLSLIDRGFEVLNKFDSPKDRCQKYLNLCEDILNDSAKSNN